MKHESKEVLSRFEVRKTGAQKEAFRAWLCPMLREHGYEPQITREKGLTKSRNIIVGDINTAKVLYTAHYDTCAALPFPNFITPRNMLWYGLYQLLIVLGIVALGILAEIALLLLWQDAPMWMAIGLVYLVLFFCLWWMLDGKANRHTANDNTSGVITLIEIMLALPRERRQEVCFIFFDNEEKGLCGSGALAKRCKSAQRSALVINFDCVGDGDSLQFFPSKKLKGEAETLALLEGCFATGENGKTSETVRSFGYYPSDQARFARGVGVCALKRNRVFGYYMSRIHTARDTVLDERNIELLCAGAVRLAEVWQKTDDKTADTKNADA